MLGEMLGWTVDPASLTTLTVSADDQVKAYIKKIMGQLDKWMVGGKISKLVVVITDKDTGEHVERWQFDVCWRLLHSTRQHWQYSGADLLKIIKVEIEIKKRRSRKCRICGSSSSWTNRSRDTIRHTITVSADHSISNISTTATRRLHFQCACVCRCW